MSAINSLLGYCYRAPAIYCIVPSPRTFITAYQKHFHWPDEKTNLKQNASCRWVTGSPGYVQRGLTGTSKEKLSKKKIQMYLHSLNK